MYHTFSISRRCLPVRCLCLLLIVLVLWCFFMVPRAAAVALEATTVAYAGLLIGTVLVGAGVVFSSRGDMAAVGNAMYKTMSDGSSAIASKIGAMASWAVEHGKSLGSAALRVGKDLYQGIVDAFNVSYSNGIYSFPSSGASRVYLAGDATDAEIQSAFDMFSGKNITSCYFVAYPNDALNRSVSQYSISCSGNYVRLIRTYLSGSSAGNSTFAAELDITDLTYVSSYLTFSDCNKYWWYMNLNVVTRNKIISTHSLAAKVCIVSLNPIDVSVSGDDLTYPSDDYLVKMPDIPAVDSATGAVTYPDSIAYTKDAISVPYPTDVDGVQVPDIPYDTVVDQSTGKTLDDTDTGTDTDNPSKPDAGTDTDTSTSLLDKIIALLTNFFDSPSDFRLDMDGFRNLAIKDKFPFCIPFDLVDSFRVFATAASDYEFRVKVDTTYWKVDYLVDMQTIALPMAFFRYFVVICFSWGLICKTRDLIKW